MMGAQCCVICGVVNVSVVFAFANFRGYSMRNAVFELIWLVETVSLNSMINIDWLLSYPYNPCRGYTNR